MPTFRCTITGGGSDEQSDRDPAPEIFRERFNVEAGSQADAEAAARERVAGRPIERLSCERESLMAIREARAYDGRLLQAAAKDGATMDEVEAAKRANPVWLAEG